MTVSPASAARPLQAEGFGATAMREEESGIIFMGNNVQNTQRLLSICHMLNLKAVLFSAPSHPAASSWRCPRPTQLLSSSGPGCCSCSHGAPGAPCVPAGCEVAGPPSPAAGLLPGNRSSPPRTLPAGHGSPAWLPSAVSTSGCGFTGE